MHAREETAYGGHSTQAWEQIYMFKCYAFFVGGAVEIAVIIIIIIPIYP